MTENPWKDIEPPNAADAINARRVDVNIPWDFFWARGLDHKCLLVLKHKIDSKPHSRLPKLKGIEVTVSEGNNDGILMLVFKLIDSAYRDIFYRLCRDIIGSASHAVSEQEAVEVAISRTWRWHHLLRGGSDCRLSPEEQKGLIGEFLVMERYLLSNLSAFEAVMAWRGPLDSPKDFEIGRVCIEAKARRGAATPFITINSEHQLDDTDIDALFLFVVDLDQAPSDTHQGFSITEVASRIRDKLFLTDNSAAETFENLLTATGFKWEDDYSDWHWIEGPSRLYLASGAFPRITAQNIESGITNVKYSLSLVECEPFLVNESVLEDALRGVKHAD